MSVASTPPAVPSRSPSSTPRGRRVGRWLRSVPRAAWLCALVAMINAFAWSLVIPPFQVPDEPNHVSYAQLLAEAGRLPQAPDDVPPGETVPPHSRELAETTAALSFWQRIGRPELRPPWELFDERVEAVKERGLSRVSESDVQNATYHPPLHHLVGAAFYLATPSDDLLDRAQVMRLFGVLLAGVTTLLIFGFLRLALPGAPWAWPFGALGAGLAPLYAFLSAGFNNDDSFIMLSSLMFLGIALGFRRAFALRVAVIVGLAIGLGIVTKLTMLAFVPGAALALLILAWRERARLGTALRRLSVAGVLGAAPLALYVLLSATVWHRPVWNVPVAYGLPRQELFEPTITGQLSYLWQYWLPKLPFMTDLQDGYPAWDTMVRGFIGNFGWLDYGFPSWAYPLGGALLAVVAGLALVELIRRRDRLAGRVGELVVYAVLALGLVAVIGWGGYTASITADGFEQARYLLPLLPLYGAVLVLAVRAGKRRFGPAIGAGILMVTLAWNVFAMLETIARYYG